MTVVNPHIKFTYEDYCLLPEDKRYELIEGELYLVPSPGVFHQQVSRNLGAIMWQYVKQNGIGSVFFAPLDVVLSREDVVQPDILFISRERKHIIKDANIQGAPDLVVEILSQSTADRDLTIKKKLYERYGVKELWIVHPVVQTIEVYLLGPEGYASPRVCARQDKEALTSPLLPGLALNLDEVF